VNSTDEKELEDVIGELRKRLHEHIDGMRNMAAEKLTTSPVRKRKVGE
jgi:hypothetical protein